MKIYIADTGVFINRKGRDRQLVTVPAVIDETKAKYTSMEMLIALETGAKVEQPDPVFRKKIVDRAEGTGDLEELSRTDIDVLAKALEYGKNAVLMTDDYAVQNVASMIGIKVEPISQSRIKDKIIWGKKCTGCMKRFDNGEECPICGSPLKKIRKRKI